MFTDGKLELGAQWIHGGCPANALFNYAATKYIFAIIYPLFASFSQFCECSLCGGLKQKIRASFEDLHGTYGTLVKIMHQNLTDSFESSV